MKYFVLWHQVGEDSDTWFVAADEFGSIEHVSINDCKATANTLKATCDVDDVRFGLEVKPL